MSQLRILIVEDNSADDKLLRYELSRDFDFTAVTVNTESEYIEKLSDFRPELILSDYSMPEFSGMRALEIRNEKTPLTPFIIVTGSVNEEVAVECIKSGASDYVTKEHLMRLNLAVKHVLEQQKILVDKLEAERDLYNSLERFKKFVEHDISGDYVETEEKVIYCNWVICRNCACELPLITTNYYELLFPLMYLLLRLHLFLNLNLILNLCFTAARISHKPAALYYLHYKIRESFRFIHLFSFCRG